MASFNPYYGSFGHLSQMRSGYDSALNQAHGGFGPAVHPTFTPPPVAMPPPNFAVSSDINMTGSKGSEDDDWEPVQTNFFNESNSSHAIVSALEKEEWTLDDYKYPLSFSYNDLVSPQYNTQTSFFNYNIDEGFISPTKTSNQLIAVYAENEGLEDNGTYMGDDENCNEEYYYQEDVQEKIDEPVEPTPFVKKPTKRDWCGNPVFQDDWDRGTTAYAVPSSTSSSYNVSAGNEEVRTILKRKCNRTLI